MTRSARKQIEDFKAKQRDNTTKGIDDKVVDDFENKAIQRDGTNHVRLKLNE